MRNGRVALAGFLFATAVSCLGADAVILRGGSRIDLREPPKQQGNTAILTKPDGTLLSIPMSEIDWKATAALRNEKPVAAKPALFAPPSAPSDALRTGHEEKARVRLTDADVGHAAEIPARPGEKPAEMKAGAPRVEVGEYTQQKSGSNLLVSGQVLNPGTTSALNARLMVSAVDEEGNSVGTTAATLANGTIEGGRAVTFSASVPVGDRVVTQLRFAPQWQVAPPPASPAAAAAAAAAAANAPASNAAPAAAAPATAASGSRPPGPAPTPYGQGSLYAAPAPSAPSTAPADGKTGYIPGASTPDNQPKPPQ